MMEGMGRRKRMVVVGTHSYRGSSPSTPLLLSRIKDENRRRLVFGNLRR